MFLKRPHREVHSGAVGVSRLTTRIHIGYAKRHVRVRRGRRRELLSKKGVEPDFLHAKNFIPRCAERGLVEQACSVPPRGLCFTLRAKPIAMMRLDRKGKRNGRAARETSLTIRVLVQQDSS